MKIHNPIAAELNLIRVSQFIVFVAAGLIALATPGYADPAQAEDDAYSMAVHYTARGFAMSPTDSSGLGSAGFTVRLLIPVSKGLDYVILVGADRAAKDLDLYVYDEVGSLILDDRRTERRAGVKFRSSYSGTVEAYVHIARADGLAAYAVLVGRRGVERSASGAAEPPQSGAAQLPPASTGAPPSPASGSPQVPSNPNAAPSASPY